MQQDPLIVPQQPNPTQPPDPFQPIPPVPQQLPQTDSAVDQVVQQGMDLHNALIQPASEQISTSEDSQDEDLTFSDAADATSVDKNEGKNPLDMLEEILGKGDGEEKKSDEEPKEPEKSPEEIQAERQALEAANQEAIESHRQQMLQEVQSTDQQKRDQIRTSQSDAIKVTSSNTIRQLQHKKIMVEES